VSRARLGVAAAAALLAGCGGGQRAAAPPPVLRIAVGAGPAPAEVATGFAVRDGRVVTVAHVLDGPGAVLAGGARARVLRDVRRLDLAMLAVGGVRARAVRTASAAAGAHVTIRVLRDGRVRTLAATVHRTITARVYAPAGAVPAVRPALELGAAVVRGDSGAPVLDRRGRVVGVVFAQAADRTRIAYAVAAPALAAVLG
jgi:S1-C subfamily serine protease